MSVGQSLMVRQQLELEKALKEKMIHSVMPPKVADWLLRDKPIDDNDDHSYTEDGAILRRVCVLSNFVKKTTKFICNIYLQISYQHYSFKLALYSGINSKIISYWGNGTYR